jgi:uncharacterized membrane protein YkoI
MSYRPDLPISLLALLLVALLAVCAPPAGARDNDDDKRHDHSHDKDRDRSRDQDRARNAMLQGEIRPLSAVLKAVRDKVPGEIIEIELDREDKGWVYEVKVLTSNGRRKKVDVDAHSLDILKID